MRKVPSSGRRKSTAPVRSLARDATPRKSRHSSPRKAQQQQQSSPSKRRSTSTNQSSADVSRRTRRFKSGAKALKEIKAFQRTTALLIPKASFCRVVKEIMNQFSYHHLRIQSSALAALQEAAEMYMVQLFEDSLLACLHSKRVTLMVHDIHLVRRLRGPSEVANK